MTPQEKAEELLDKYLSIDETYNVDLFCDECGMSYEAAKYCALIAVAEVITESMDNEYSEKYWQEVKQEIEKL